MTKAEIRTLFLAQRKALTEATVQQRSEQIAQRFLAQFAPLSAHTVHVFLPIARQRELDTWPIIKQLWHSFPTVQVVVSISSLTTNRLSHYALNPETLLVENRWGIPEPTGELHMVPSQPIDIVLVPLLAFDLRGHRVGYGKGYYDRFLIDCRPDCQKIGLSLFEPVDSITDILPTDVALDLCITPEHTYCF